MFWQRFFFKFRKNDAWDVMDLLKQTDERQNNCSDQKLTNIFWKILFFIPFYTVFSKFLNFNIQVQLRYLIQKNKDNSFLNILRSYQTKLLTRNSLFFLRYIRKLKHFLSGTNNFFGYWSRCNHLFCPKIDSFFWPFYIFAEI